MTNREIAAAVYLCEKTVERHLSRIYAKLGVSGRTALACAMAAGAERDGLIQRALAGAEGEG